MSLRKKIPNVGKKLCPWALVAAMLAGGSGWLRPLDAVFAILGIVLFGVACTVLTPSSPSPAAPDPDERP